MTTIEIYAVGKLAATIQRHPSEIREAAVRLSIPPAFLINDVPHFDSQSCQRLTEHFRRSAEEAPP